MARGKANSATTATPPRPRGAAWRPTEIQKHYSELLAQAKDEPQTIEASDGSLLILEEKGSADFYKRLAQVMAEVSQFGAAYDTHRGEDSASWAAQTPYPWIRSLDTGEIKEFADEVLAYALDGAARQTLENFDGLLAAWRSTAETYEAPEILAQMTAEIDSGD
jgi:hypothetical protein